MDLLTQLRSEWKMISSAPIHFAFAVVVLAAAAFVVIWNVMNWRWRALLENTVARYRAEIAERNYQLTTLRGQMEGSEKTARRVDDAPIPQEIYDEVTLTGEHRHWTRREIDNLPEDEKAKMKRRKPGLWRWYLGEPLRPLTYEEMEKSEERLPLP